MSPVTVLGAGAWGATLADLLARKGASVLLWDRDPDNLRRIQQSRTSSRLPALRLHESIACEPSFESAIAASTTIVCAVPSFAVRAICQRIQDLPGGLADKTFVSCSKGIEEESLLLPSQVFADVFGKAALYQFAVLAGPSHAEEVCRQVPTVVVCCSARQQTAETVRDLFFQPTFRVYTQDDCVGVELGGALKNVIAVAAGACDGLGFGDNTKAALITRGLAEIARLGCALGAQARTLSGLAGLGDLIVTAGSRHSRNRGFGELLARGRSAEGALQEIGAVVEAYRTTRSAYDLSRKHNVEMPILDAVHAVLYRGATLPEAMKLLLERDPRAESE